MRYTHLPIKGDHWHWLLWWREENLMNAEKKDLGVGIDKKLAQYVAISSSFSDVYLYFDYSLRNGFQSKPSCVLLSLSYGHLVSSIQYYFLFSSQVTFASAICLTSVLVPPQYSLCGKIEPSSQTKVRQQRRRRGRPCKQRPSTKSNNRRFPRPASGTNPKRNNRYFYIFIVLQPWYQIRRLSRLIQCIPIAVQRSIELTNDRGEDTSTTTYNECRASEREMKVN